jgi:hypothetical protein
VAQAVVASGAADWSRLVERLSILLRGQPSPIQGIVCIDNMRSVFDADMSLREDGVNA